jgi:hypothetical protein
MSRMAREGEEKMKPRMIVQEIKDGYFFTFFAHGFWMGECKVVFEDDCEAVVTEAEWQEEAEAQVYCDWAKRTALMIEE